MPKQQVCLCLIAAAVAFEPVDHVVIQPDGYGPLRRPIKPANLSAAPVENLGHVGEVNHRVGLGGDGGDVPLLRGCELLHRTSFHERMRFERR